MKVSVLNCNKVELQCSKLYSTLKYKNSLFPYEALLIYCEFPNSRRMHRKKLVSINVLSKGISYRLEGIYLILCFSLRIIWTTLSLNRRYGLIFSAVLKFPQEREALLRAAYEREQQVGSYFLNQLSDLEV